jgi:DNA-binding transcriptional ArsR family regulator
VAKSNAARKPRIDAPSHARPIAERHSAFAAAKTAGVKHAGGIATELDRLLHDRMRLGIVSALAASDDLSFSDLKGALNATDGNLSVHARKLEDAGYVACSKGFDGRTPRTSYKLTASGRRALEKYLDHMDAIIRATRRA